MTPEVIATLPYRPCVGLMVCNAAGNVFAGQRLDNYGDAWQMPQGGVMATLTGPRRALSNFSILGALLRRPFGSRRVLGLIHLQALRLWWKGAKYRPRPTPPKAEIS